MNSAEAAIGEARENTQRSSATVDTLAKTTSAAPEQRSSPPLPHKLTLREKAVDWLQRTFEGFWPDFND